MELILPLHFRENINFNNNNNINSHKYKSIILFNIFVIVSYIIFMYYYYNEYSRKEKNNSILDEASDLYRKLNDENNINDNLKLSQFKAYNNKYYEITREKYLYEKQKEFIFLSLINQIFIGEWNSSTNNSDINSGETTIYFDKAYERKSRQIALGFEIKNKNGKYIDSWLKTVSFTRYQNLIKKINLSKKTFELNGQFLTEFEKGEIFNSISQQKNCISIINITFPLLYMNINVTTLNGNNIYLGLLPIINNNSFTMRLRSNCGLGFDINAKIIKPEEELSIKEGRLKIYLFLCLFGAIFYGLGIIFLYCGIKNNEGYIYSINIEIFSINTVWNFYCCVTNIYIAFNTDFNFFLVFCCIGLLSLFKILAFDMIIYATYWKIKERRIIQYCQLIKLKLRFYSFLFISLIASFFFLTSFLVNYYCIILLSFFLWFPQIIYNMISNNKYGFPFIFILTCSLDRLIYPFYFRAYENNYFELKTNYIIFVLSLLIIMTFVIILLAQTFKGPRFILPFKYQENKNEYYKTFDEIKNICKNINEECVICLMPIYPENENEMLEMKENNIAEETNSENTTEQIIDSIIPNNSDENSISDSNKLLIKEENNQKEKPKITNNKIIKRNKCFNFLRKTWDFLKEFFKNNFFYFYKSSSYNTKPFILTPCKHIFHSFCLNKWLEQKEECPNCRQSLENYI